MIEVRKYRKPDGYPTRYWGIYVDGNLLAVVLYRKGAEAIAVLLGNQKPAANPEPRNTGDHTSRFS